MIRLVCFDLGRVLIRICDGWPEACARAGVPSPALTDPAAFREIERLGEEHECGRIDTAGFVHGVARVTGLAPAQVEAIARAWLKGAFPGAAELVREVAAGPVASACLSNTNALHWSQMFEEGSPHRLPLEQFTHRFASHHIGAMKPAPAIYEHVEKTTGLPPESILFFDDHAPNIHAAAARRWHAHRIDTSADPIAQMRGILHELHLLPR